MIRFRSVFSCGGGMETKNKKNMYEKEMVDTLILVWFIMNGFSSSCIQNSFFLTYLHPPTRLNLPSSSSSSFFDVRPNIPKLKLRFFFTSIIIFSFNVVPSSFRNFYTCLRFHVFEKVTLRWSMIVLSVFMISIMILFFSPSLRIISPSFFIVLWFRPSVSLRIYYIPQGLYASLFGSLRLSAPISFPFSMFIYTYCTTYMLYWP